jgi:hypothetical protein
MASQVSICNQALGWLGANLITSLNDDNREAQLCKTNYDDIRDAVLEEREWTFAVRRITLAPLVLPPVYGYGNQFLLPPDVMRVLNIPDTTFGGTVLGGNQFGGLAQGPDQQPQLPNWRKESIEDPAATGNVILANVDQLVLRVIWRVTNIGLYSPMFIQCLAQRIAADLCIPLTQNRGLWVDMWRVYEQKLIRASAMDGIQGAMERKRSNAVQRVR